MYRSVYSSALSEKCLNALQREPQWQAAGPQMHPLVECHIRKTSPTNDEHWMCRLPGVRQQHTSSCVSFLTNDAGLPPQTSFPGINFAGGTTVPGSKIAFLDTTLPSITMERSPMTAMFSILHERRRLPAPIVTAIPISVEAGSPVGPFLQRALTSAQQLVMLHHQAMEL